MQPFIPAKGLYLWTVWSLHLVDNKFNWSKVSIFKSRQFYRIPRSWWIARAAVGNNRPPNIVFLNRNLFWFKISIPSILFYGFILCLLSCILLYEYNSFNLICVREVIHRTRFYREWKFSRSVRTEMVLLYCVSMQQRVFIVRID